MHDGGADLPEQWPRQMTKDHHQGAVYGIFDRTLCKIISTDKSCSSRGVHLDAALHLQLIRPLLMVEPTTSV